MSMTETKQKELWMRESTEFTMSDGSTVNGYRINFVRFMEEGETLDDIDDRKEFDEVVGGSVVPTNVDDNYNEIDEDEVEDEDIDMFNPTFYIGDDNGKPIEE
jgi:hypothetical protein